MDGEESEIVKNDGIVDAAPKALERSAYAVAGVTLLWYTCSFLGSSSTKNLLTVFPYPTSMTMVENAASIMFPLRSAALRGKVWNLPFRTIFKQGIILGVSQAVASVLHRQALLLMSVSLTQSLKCTQPLFACMLSVTVLKEPIQFRASAGLFLICCGILLITVRQASFDGLGLFCALSSAAVLAIRTIMAKRLLQETQIDPSVLVAVTKTFGLVSLLPLWCWKELPEVYAHAVWRTSLLTRIALTALLLNAAAIFATWVLCSVSPVSHSAINSMKRVVIILGSVIYFQEGFGPLQYSGVFLTMFGTHMYSQDKLQVNAKRVGASLPLGEV